MPEEQQTTTQTPPDEVNGGEGTTGGGEEVENRGGADGKAKALGSHGIGDYGRPSTRAAADEADGGGK